MIQQNGLRVNASFFWTDGRPLGNRPETAFGEIVPKFPRWRLQARAAQIRPFSKWRVIRPGHWERAQISEMGIVGS